MSAHGGSADDRTTVWISTPRRSGKEISVPRVRLQVLSREDIDRRIEQLASQVACDLVGSSETSEGHRGMPRWISAKELVARVRPFLVYN
jgi:hypothetical protein